jgi:uncharacterized membrane protein
MAVLVQILLVAHVLSAMLWFGGSAFAPRELREALDSERAEARRRMTALKRRTGLFGITAVIVVLTGVALGLSVPGGFGALGPRYHVALLLSVVWLAIVLFGVRPAVDRVAAIVLGDAELDSARALAKRARTFTALLHPLFITVLVLMLWRL